MNYDTHSEDLFAAICRRHRCSYKTLITRSEAGRNTIDFEVISEAGRFVAGVDELLPNKADLREIKKSERKPGPEITVGSRARKTIRAVAVQLGTYKEREWPLLIVLYDNVRGPEGRVGHPMFYVEAHQIDVAMYGEQESVLQRWSRWIRPNWFPKDRTMTSTERTCISAVAVISDWDDQSLFVFHNCFAKIPFPRAVFSDEKTFHYEKRGKPYTDQWKWHKIDLTRT